MKKDYVSLNVQVINVQLSDCIAGSGKTFKIKQGTTEAKEVSTKKFGGSDDMVFELWNE